MKMQYILMHPHLLCRILVRGSTFKTYSQIVLQRPIQYTPPKPGINLKAIFVYHVAELLDRNAL